MLRCAFSSYIYLFLLFIFRQIEDEREQFSNSSQGNVKQITKHLQEIKQQWLETVNGEVKSSGKRKAREVLVRRWDSLMVGSLQSSVENAMRYRHPRTLPYDKIVFCLEFFKDLFLQPLITLDRSFINESCSLSYLSRTWISIPPTDWWI